MTESVTCHWISILWSILQCSELSQAVKKENSYLDVVSNYPAGYPAEYPALAGPLASTIRLRPDSKIDYPVHHYCRLNLTALYDVIDRSSTFDVISHCVNHCVNTVKATAFCVQRLSNVYNNCGLKQRLRIKLLLFSVKSIRHYLFSVAGIWLVAFLFISPLVRMSWLVGIIQ